MDWLPIVAPVVASLGTLLLTQLFANKSAESQRAAERERWDFEARERRFENRLEAVVALDVAAEESSLAGFAWQRTHPDDVGGPESDGGVLEAALARTLVLGTPEVVAAADKLYMATIAVFLGQDDGFEFYGAQKAYRAACRGMLAEAPGATSAPAPAPARRAAQTKRLDPAAAERAQSISPGTPWPSAAEAAPPAENAQHVSEDGGGESPVRA